MPQRRVRGRARIVVTIIGLLAFVVTCLYVPVQGCCLGGRPPTPAGWWWITEIGRWDSAGYSYSIDFGRLALLWLAIAALLAIAHLTCDAFELATGEPGNTGGTL